MPVRAHARSLPCKLGPVCSETCGSRPAQMFWECDTVQAQPGCMVCREILQRPLAGFMKYTPGKLFTLEQGARRKSRRIRKPARALPNNPLKLGIFWAGS